MATNGTETAQQQLAVTDFRGSPNKDYTNPNIVSTGRERSDFESNKFTQPGGNGFDERAISKDR